MPLRIQCEHEGHELPARAARDLTTSRPNGGSEEKGINVVKVGLNFKFPPQDQMLIAGDLIRPKHTPWRARELSVESGGQKRFCLVLVKPSHYDDDGYVIQWFRSPIPSTSLAALYGLA